MSFIEINILLNHISGEGWKSTKVEKWGKIDISREGRKMSEKWKIKSRVHSNDHS